MKTFFAATLALSMLAAPAIAAPRDHQGDKQGQHQSRNNSNDQHKGQDRSKRNDRDRDRAQNQRRENANANRDRNNGGNHWTQNNDRRGHDARPQAHRQYSYNGRHYNAVRGPAWHAPRGHDARRTWSRGERMHSSYRSRSYVIDYRAYHLARPSYGYEWVRAGNNVYLVRASNGLVAQIVWNMFY